MSLMGLQVELAVIKTTIGGFSAPSDGKTPSESKLKSGVHSSTLVFLITH